MERATGVPLAADEHGMRCIAQPAYPSLPTNTECDASRSRRPLAASEVFYRSRK